MHNLRPFHQLERQLDDQLEQVRTVRAELAELRFEADRADGTVRAGVDGEGALLTLHIANGALSAAHPASLGA